MRALVIAHGHPDAGLGGGELAAHNLFRGLRARPDIAATFLGRTADARMAQGAIEPLRNGEYLWARRTGDGFSLQGADGPRTDVRDFLRASAPDVVFVHHYVHIGVEVLSDIRAVLPKARLVLTLHDYAAICHNGGLMAKTGFAKEPCAKASGADCHACFQDRSLEAFDRRREALLEHFAAVDRFVSPSHFLKTRYADWGLPPDRIHVVANGLEPFAADIEPGPIRSADGLLRLGFFGQARDVKGLDILLAALHHLTGEERSKVLLEVNASRLEAQPLWYQDLVERLARPLIEAGTVCWQGGYTRGELPERMGRIDWAVVPSIWWENAPLVIDEAFRFGRPVIGARLGGIAERLREGVDALLFEPRDGRALADLLRSLIGTPHRHGELQQNIRPPQTLAGMAEIYLALAM